MARRGGGGIPNRDPFERFTEKYKADRETGCFVWTGATNSQGYGAFGFGGRGKTVLAHRWAYVHIGNKEIPPGLVVDHICRNRRCVNTEHLRVLTRIENVMIGEGYPAQNARATHCAAGHELSGANLRIRPDRKRACVECGRRWGRESAARARAARKTISDMPL